jgi:hypothetical protein
MHAIELGGNAARTETVGNPSCSLFTPTDRSHTLLILNPDGSLHCQESEQSHARRHARLEFSATLALSRRFKYIVAQVIHFAIDTHDFDRLELRVSEPGFEQ